MILLGCRAPWYPPSAKPGDATVLVIDETPHRPHIAYQVLTADRYVGGEMAATLRALTAAIRAIGVDQAAVAARRQRLAEAYLESEASRSLAESKAAAAPPRASAGEAAPATARSTRSRRRPRCARRSGWTRWWSTRPSRTAA